mgnify:CR=1 FL=1
MNGRQSKKIRNKTKDLMCDWLQNYVPEDEFKKANVTSKNILKFVPPDTHVYANRQMHLSTWSFKWIIKKLKRVDIDKLNDITIEDLGFKKDA